MFWEGLWEQTSMKFETLWTHVPSIQSKRLWQWQVLLKQWIRVPYNFDWAPLGVPEVWRKYIDDWRTNILADYGRMPSLYLHQNWYHWVLSKSFHSCCCTWFWVVICVAIIQFFDANCAPRLSSAEACCKSTDKPVHVSRKDGGESMGPSQPCQDSLWEASCGKWLLRFLGFFLDFLLIEFRTGSVRLMAHVLSTLHFGMAWPIQLDIIPGPCGQFPFSKSLKNQVVHSVP